MSFEVEVKYRTDHHADLLSRLEAFGARSGSAVEHEDLYLSHPARDFARSNEALRIRRIGPENRITYKGPKRSGPTKTREEIEVELEGGDEAFDKLARLFTALGFRSVAIVRKTRRPFHFAYDGHRVEVVLDTAEGLGEFAEIETIAASEADLPSAQRVVLEVAKRLGLSTVEPRSYLRMNLESRGLIRD